MSRDKYKPLVVASIIILIFFLYIRTFIWLVGSWLTNPFYQHGFLVPLISGFFIWRVFRKKDELKRAEKDYFGLGFMLFGFGLFIYLVGILWKAYFISAFSFIIVLCGLVLYLYDKEVTRKLLFPICFLVLMIPLPFLDIVSTYLASVSASCASAIVYTMGIAASNIGAEIILDRSYFVVGVPCSGLRTLVSLSVLIIILIYILECPMLVKTVLFSVIIPIALLSNVLRLVLLLVIADFYGEEVAMGFFHTFYGLIIPVISFISLIIISRCLGCLKLRDI